ncbi:ABC transporter substrate-binding protein [Anaerocolumna sp. MB42-C2]|uniref:ABC transporter substrate-binding protein n=1 Tax=Anaerocolumna sp. MB42-C2 TaxID=3070997 RepID=UPI0027E1AB95|nr:sugar ABC transporter substrate-binding protein [Anaerocolumna sp. MB42-C2]WMJ89864.1 sugar ABC transporter substrate-binding protein [Anaerocolumna sp. MB42-C2]
MKLKKVLAVCLVLVIAAVTIVGCSKDNSKTTNSASGAKPDTTSADQTAAGVTKSGDSGDVVTLNFMGWEASPLETAAVEDGIAIFEKAHPNIKVNYTPGLAGSEYNAKLMTAAASNSMPDVMFMMANAYRQFVSKGALLEITDKFNEEFPLDDFIDSSKTIMSIDGKVYGVSSCTVSPILYYNKDVFDKAGVEYPSSDPANSWTIDQFREVAKKLTSADVYGCYGLETVADTLAAQIISNGGARYSDDFKTSTMNTPEVKEVLETIKAVRVEDGSAPDATTLDSVGMKAVQMLETGKVAMLIDGSWALQELAASGMNVGMAPLPSYGKVLTTGQAHLHCIAAGTKYPEQAWEFVQFLSSLDYQGSLVSSGLWMPNRKSMYEDDMVAKWYKDDVHGDSYKNMLDYFQNAMVDPSALQYSSKCSDIISEETKLYFTDAQDIDTTLQNIDKRSDEAIAEALE